MFNVPKMEKSEKQMNLMPGGNVFNVSFPVFPNPVMTPRSGQSFQENIDNSGVNCEIFNNLAKNTKQGFSNQVVHKVGFYLLLDV